MNYIHLDQMEEAHRVMSESMHGNSKSGFTLFELLVAMLIIGIIASLIGPSLFQQRTPRYEREQFVARLNSMVATAVQQAILERTVHSLDFNFKKRLVELKRAPRPGANGDDFELVKGLGELGHYQWPEQFEIKQFIIEGNDMMKAFTKKEAESAWFFIISQGMTQEVTINLLDNKDTIEGNARKVGLVLNPFTAQFKVYDAFQK